jgi:nucleotide-binding universal stress UspA family protein
MKVLICVDSGESAQIVLREAQTIVKGSPEAEIHLFTVIDMAVIAVGQDTDQTMMMDTLQREASSLIPTATRILGDRPLIFSSEVGYPVDEILKKAKEVNCDLLILGTHGRTGFDHLLIGSVAEKVLRNCECNTLIIPMKHKLK